MARGSSPQSPGQRMLIIFVVYCIVLSCDCLDPRANHNLFHTPMARYSLFVPKVPLNIDKPNQTVSADHQKTVSSYLQSANIGSAVTDIVFICLSAL